MLKINIVYDPDFIAIPPVAIAKLQKLVICL